MRALGAREMVSFFIFFMDFIHLEEGALDSRARARDTVGRNTERAAGFCPPPDLMRM